MYEQSQDPRTLKLELIWHKTVLLYDFLKKLRNVTYSCNNVLESLDDTFVTLAGIWPSKENPYPEKDEDLDQPVSVSI